jgi:glycosyltransferase involved in cell wall biosynthesis
MTVMHRVLALIPAHNEAANLPRVMAELRHRYPDAAIVVVDDGSTDGTLALLRRMNVRWLHWPERRGVGCAVRAGLRYASTLGFDVVVRLDADGQHDVEDVERLLAPIHAGTADAVIGSRFTDDATAQRASAGPVRRGLAAMLSMLTHRVITDPTSGFWAMGPRAVDLLAEHHPRGYPEPELHLFLSRNALRLREVQVRSRARLSGRSSLTPTRLVAAGARVLLAMLIVPFRAVSGSSSRD